MLLTKDGEYDCVRLLFDGRVLDVHFTTIEEWRMSIEEEDSCEEGGRIIYNKVRVYECEKVIICNLTVDDVAPQLQHLTLVDIFNAASQWVRENEEANECDFAD
ncbi:hypothetical protein UFOVP1192_39 [uncultured Caudovirales phage]|uniref:Uncharacterized protein n=1 Tax=uncultured Caudovirales phage TaxID=2100421 RepID=A0A6J5R6A8_9CAUD|nr:hypothetical protein UFOVP1192_39 [uncultured Caudovirales phage]